MGAGGRRGLALPGPGSAASARGAPPGPYLPSSRALMSRRCRGSGWRGGGGGRRRGPRGPLPPPPPRPERPAAATTAQPPRTRYFRRREFPGSPTPRPHSPPPLRAAPALTPSSAPPRRGRGGGEGGGEGGGCGYLRARPASSPELAPRPPGLERPPPSGAGALRRLRAVPPRSPSAASPSHLSGPNMAAGSWADSRGGAG